MGLSLPRGVPIPEVLRIRGRLPRSLYSVGIDLIWGVLSVEVEPES